MDAIVWWLKYIVATAVICELLKTKIKSKTKLVLLTAIIASIFYQCLGIIITGSIDKLIPIALFFGTIFSAIIAVVYLFVSQKIKGKIAQSKV